MRADLPGLLATSAVMNLFMLGRYDEAAERARRTVTTNSHVPFYSPLPAAALERSGRYAKAHSLVDDFRVRNPGFDAATIALRWPATNPRFLQGRERIATTVRALGLP